MSALHPQTAVKTTLIYQFQINKKLTMTLK